MNRQEAADKIKAITKEIQPDAYINISSGSFGKTSLCITYATGKTWENSIIHNDFGHTQIWIHEAWDEDTGEQVRPFTLDSSMFGYRNYKNGYKNNCKFRKINKGVEWPAIEKALVSYFTEMKAAIKADKGGR